MAYEAKVIADSISPAGVRLTTLEVEGPRSILAEFNTHRDFSRNSASSRAIPVTKILDRVSNDPFTPYEWGLNQPGMVATEVLDVDKRTEADEIWLKARDSAVEHATSLTELGVHKQVVNRLLEPFMWHKIIVTATSWDNFFALRRSPNAQPEIHQLANAMFHAREESYPSEVVQHLPYIQSDETHLAKIDFRKWALICSARCARVSYLTHDGQRDISEDLRLANTLTENGHMSPFEHVATAWPNSGYQSGNFRGWQQFRKTLPYENDYSHYGGPGID